MDVLLEQFLVILIGLGPVGTGIIEFWKEE